MYRRDGEKLHCTHRQRLMYGVDLNVLAERHAALHSKAMRLQARAVDAASRIANWRLERDEEVRITRRVVNDRRYSKHLNSLSLRYWLHSKRL